MIIDRKPVYFCVFCRPLFKRANWRHWDVLISTDWFGFYSDLGPISFDFTWG